MVVLSVHVACFIPASNNSFLLLHNDGIEGVFNSVVVMMMMMMLCRVA